jgi:hypothetical protein
MRHTDSLANENNTGNTQQDFQMGSLEEALTGNTKVRLRDVFREAWLLTDGVKGSFLAATCLYYFISGATGFILNFVFNVQMDPESLGNNLISLAISFVLYPMLIGVFMMGVQRSMARTVSFTMVFEYYKYILPIGLMSILGFLIVVVGTALLIIPGIYLAVSYSFALPLIVDKQLGIWEALETSRKAVSRRWFSVFGLLFLLFVIILLSFALALIPLIWTLPLCHIAYGIAYRNIFGVTSSID